MALGASAGRVVARVLGGVAARVAIGAAIGIGLTAWIAPVVSTLRLRPDATRRRHHRAARRCSSPPSAPLAGWLPARRIARIDPARVLRDG